MEHLTQFLSMDGYAAYVWPALGFAALVLVAMTLASVARLRASEAALRNAEADAPSRRRRDMKDPRA